MGVHAVRYVQRKEEVGEWKRNRKVGKEKRGGEKRRLHLVSARLNLPNAKGVLKPLVDASIRGLEYQLEGSS